MSNHCICLLAKPPIAGHSKTRLAARIGDERAAALARAFLLDTWSVLGELASATRVVSTTQTDGLPPMDTEPWLQGTGDLGARLERTLQRALADHTTAIAVGADSPGMPLHLYTRAFEALKTHDAVLGPTLDGGFYLLGLRACPTGLLDGIPWSSPETCARTRAQLVRAGLSIATLPTWWDVDELGDLDRLAAHLASRPEAAPNTARELGLSPVSQE